LFSSRTRIAPLGTLSLFPAPRRWRFLLRFRLRPISDEHLADQLHRTGIELAADALERLLPRFAVIAQHADLDQFMAFESKVDFLQDGRSQARIPDHHDRVQRVRAGAQRAPFGVSQLFHENQSAILEGRRV
jgi:hypothetical protein